MSARKVGTTWWRDLGEIADTKDLVPQFLDERAAARVSCSVLGFAARERQ